MYNVAISSYVKLFSIDCKVILYVRSLKTTSFFEIMFIRTITVYKKAFYHVVRLYTIASAIIN